MKWNLSKKEEWLFKRLSTPQKIQDYLNSIPNNFEEHSETCMSPRRVMREKKAHCIEGAIFAGAVLWYHGKKPLVLHFSTTKRDEDHVIALFKEGGLWGAISKTNHAILRYRDPVFKTIRELALSYFNEYYEYGNGKKSLRGYTSPINLKIFGNDWVTEERELWGISDELTGSKHIPIVPKNILKKLRPADPIELKILIHTDWKKR